MLLPKLLPMFTTCGWILIKYEMYEQLFYIFTYKVNADIILYNLGNSILLTPYILTYLFGHTFV